VNDKATETARETTEYRVYFPRRLWARVKSEAALEEKNINDYLIGTLSTLYREYDRVHALDGNGKRRARPAKSSPAA
jgi:hypothetical protein